MTAACTAIRLIDSARQWAEHWRTLQLYGEQLMICTESGCRVAGAADLADVQALLPELLSRQDQAAHGSIWEAMARQQQVRR